MKARSLLLALVAACGGSETTPDAAAVDEPGQVTTLDQLPYVDRFAIAGDCLVVASSRILSCVSMTGAPTRRIAMFDETPIVSVIADGTDAIVTRYSVRSDATLYVDRVSLDGQITPIGSPGRFDPTNGGKGLALAGDRVAVTTNHTLDTFAKTGGGHAQHASVTSLVGEVAVVGTDAYCALPPLIYRYDLAAPGSEPTALDRISMPFPPSLASDGTNVLAVLDPPELGKAIVHLLPDPVPVAKLPGAPGRGAIRGDRAWVVAGMAIHEIDLATGESTAIVTGERAVDLAVTDDALYWANQAGELRRRAR
ncbi:MAG: hypothetical protein ACTHU0_01635 [Kofleriaceae bacterium]